MTLNVIIGCERSGVVAGAFRKRGHNAYSCDILKASDTHPCPEFHLQCDVREALRWKPWDVGIFHPDCTYLTVSGLHWNTRGRLVDGRPRADLTEESLKFVFELMACGIPRWAIENPVGCISTRIRKPDQIIQPYQYGHDASKKTCLWTQGLPQLVPTCHIEPRIINGLPRWSNQTDSGQNKLGPSGDRWELRSRTYEGIAEAMAEQWGSSIDASAGLSA